MSFSTRALIRSRVPSSAVFAMTGSGNASGTTLSGATFAAGETVLVGLAMQNGGAGSVSDGTNTYTHIGTCAPTGAVSVGVYKADNVAAGTYTITSSGTSGLVTGVAYFRYTGLTAGAVQATVITNMNPSGNSAADAITAGNITPTSAPALIFGFVGDQNSNAPTAGTNYTTRGPLSNITTSPVNAEDRRVVTTAAVACTMSATGGANFDQYGMVFCAIGCV